jgi:hypothetical protein
MAKRGRPTFESQGKLPPKTNKERSRKSYARKREDKFLRCFTRLEALVLHRVARIALEDGCYHLMTGGSLQRRADVDHAVARRVFEGLLQETEWALTDGDPPK